MRRLFAHMRASASLPGSAPAFRKKKMRQPLPEAGATTKAGIGFHLYL
jgi:hypothetical protein